MGRSFIGVVSMVLIGLVSVPALAESAGRIELTGPVRLGDQRLEPGSYSIHWKTHSPEATVTVRRDGKSVATVEARVIEQEEKFQNTRFLVIHGPEGDVLKELGCSGSKQLLVFGQ